MSVTVRYFTDPACSWSWSTEPTVRKLMVEFGESLRWTFVMAGLARDYTSGHDDPEAGIGGSGGVDPGLVNHWRGGGGRRRPPEDPPGLGGGAVRPPHPAPLAPKGGGGAGRDT